MAKIYAAKIRERAINPATGLAWRIEDVPARWREDVRKLVEESGS